MRRFSERIRQRSIFSVEKYEVKTSWHILPTDDPSLKPSSQTSFDDNIDDLQLHSSQQFFSPATDANAEMNVFLMPIEELMHQSSLLYRFTGKRSVKAAYHHVVVPRHTTIAHLSKYLEMKFRQREVASKQPIWPYPFALFVRVAPDEYCPSVQWVTMGDLLDSPHNRRPYGSDARYNLIKLYYTHGVKPPTSPPSSSKDVKVKPKKVKSKKVGLKNVDSKKMKPNKPKQMKAESKKDEHKKKRSNKLKLKKAEPKKIKSKRGRPTKVTPKKKVLLDSEKIALKVKKEENLEIKEVSKNFSFFQFSSTPELSTLASTALSSAQPTMPLQTSSYSLSSFIPASHQIKVEIESD